MNNLDIISVNIWQIALSLINLVILFLILKKLLFKPVKKIIAEREKEIMAEYDKASATNAEAEELKASYEKQMEGAKARADEIIQDAVDKADRRNEVMLYETREKAEGIIKKAKADADRDLRDAQESIRQEIISVSTALSEKIIGREINMDDHRDLIDSFIDNMGDE